MKTVCLMPYAPVSCEDVGAAVRLVTQLAVVSTALDKMFELEF